MKFTWLDRIFNLVLILVVPAGCLIYLIVHPQPTTWKWARHPVLGFLAGMLALLLSIFFWIALLLIFKHYVVVPNADNLQMV